MKRLVGIAVLLLLGGSVIAQPIAQPKRITPPPSTVMTPRVVVPKGTAGKPMQTRALTARARISGLQVEVTTSLVFFNPNNRILEGELEFPLPDGAVVTGYSLDVNGRMVEGVVVKKEQARVAFESETRRRVDPGIVEHTAGNVYRTRIYPLPAQGERKVEIRYVTQLPADKNGDIAWHLPMPVGEKIGKLSIRVEVAQSPVKPQIGGFGKLKFETFQNTWVAKAEFHDVNPGEDLWVALPKLPRMVTALERAANGEVYFAISDLSPSHTNQTLRQPRRLGVAFDASGSRAGDHLQKEFAVLKELLAHWPQAEITLLVFRDRVDDAKAFRDVNQLIAALQQTPLDGGTDLPALAQAIKRQDQVDQWILLTDGMDTLSDQLPDFGNRRVTSLVSQTIGQRELLRQACTASGGGMVDLLRLSPSEAAREILDPTPRLVAVRGSGVADLQGLGSSVIGRAAIYGKLTADRAQLTLEFSDGSTSSPVAIDRHNATDGRLVASVWAAQRVSQLSVRPESNEDELLALGRRFRVVSPLTSLIVLETVDQYLRYDIEPPSSCPEWQQQWRERKAWLTKENMPNHSQQSDRVARMWQQRTDWWENRDMVYAPKKIEGTWGSPPIPESTPMRARNQAIEPMPVPAAAAPGLGRDPIAGTTRIRAANAVSDLSARAKSDGEVVNLRSVGGELRNSVNDAFDRSQAKPVTIEAWDPKTPYLQAIKAAPKDERYARYLEFRKTYSRNAGFYVDCADYFLREGNPMLGIRILSNLGELRVDDAAMLRIMGWRLQQAGDLDRAVVLLRKAAKLRPEEPQSSRDLGLVLAERGKSRQNPADISEALKLLEKTISGNWQRFEEIEVIGLEEFNALAAWVKKSPLSGKVAMPVLDSRFTGNHDVDVRIVMSWDADDTDVDLHVVEPSGEEAYYGNNRTPNGGLVSHDFTQGYGPEEYMVRHAKPGVYRIFAHYYGSRQQTMISPCTVTVSVFTDFGRPNEKKQVLTLRLESPREQANVGSIQIGPKGIAMAKPVNPVEVRELFRALKAGQPESEVQRLVGTPQKKESLLWMYRVGDYAYEVRFAEKAGLQSVREILPGGVIMILVQ